LEVKTGTLSIPTVAEMFQRRTRLVGDDLTQAEGCVISSEHAAPKAGKFFSEA
jgi:hypothetical protein